MVNGLTAFCTVSARARVVRRACGFAVAVVRCVDVAAGRVVVVWAAGLLGVAVVDSRDGAAAFERAADCRLGFGVEQAANPITMSPARRIIAMSPPTAGWFGAG